jgi:hypothetical protein
VSVRQAGSKRGSLPDPATDPNVSGVLLGLGFVYRAPAIV